jgi:hypothetical protein
MLVRYGSTIGVRPANIGSYSACGGADVVWTRSTIFAKVTSTDITGLCGSSIVVSSLIFVN